jgi:hypothetical protein
MKNLFLSFMLLLPFSLLLIPQLQAEVKNKPVIGEWIYEVSDAPYGYEKGSLIFSEKGGQTICIIKLVAGELAVSNLKVNKNKITFTTAVDGNSIHVELIRKKNKLSGTVDTPEGPKTLSAIKKESN